MKVSLAQIKVNGRTLSVGSLVRIKPSSPGKRDGMIATVRAIHGDDETRRILDVEVLDPYNGGIRNFPPSRVLLATKRRNASVASS